MHHRDGDVSNCFDLGMLIFWTLQTVCFAVDSIYHDINAGYAVIVMICTFIICPLSYLLLTLHSLVFDVL